MNSTRSFIAFGAAAAAALLLLSAAFGDDAPQKYKFSDPTKPGTLKVHVGQASIVIHGSDAPDITVATNLASPEPVVRKDGLRVLSVASGYTLEEKNNVAQLSYGFESRGEGHGNFDITVPRTTAIVIHSSYGGQIACSDITGDLEITCLNGSIRLDGIKGGALVESTNGSIRANIVELHPGHALSFTSTNGAVSIRVPADAKANVNLRTQNGKILTDFDDKALVTKSESVPGTKMRLLNSNGDDSDGRLGEETREQIRNAAKQAAEATRKAYEVAREAFEAAKEGASAGTGAMPAMPPMPPMPPLPSMTGGKIVTGTLNGGGPEIQAATINGDVTVRKSAQENSGGSQKP